ncbi:bifunctional folylpolyglutamate synthase/dihydrofolate synthase [Agathobaculum sp.]|uniref:bifunctional folylpolyglutamate synthase/dihydrofolate synthase n=1 Tax=Agathobaculum sp. TaxID=2048138 RepID=UPI002A83E804|nr:folylpolyglutamate synthase/dihydrofolate synthase family protein [Agathobaculum sp.]MDY3617668.1 folylpolyglutamate synthase/dihydrofolate synthase family protein [Agathobaculum sp.]
MDTDLPKTAIDYIHSLGRFSGKPGLHRIRALCAALGDPQKTLKFVHLAGTNGKGSTACMLASVLRAAGYRTGLYTSPYLIHFHERIRVDGAMIPDGDLTRLVERVGLAAQSLILPDGESIGEFEFTTALAFLYFAEQGCDIVVLETGLGGRCDATNVIDAPEAVVLTPISRDHMAVLGDTVAEIAAEKAAVIKPGSAVICANGQPGGVMPVVLRACEAAGGIWWSEPLDIRLLRMDIEGTAFVYEGQGYTIPMSGRHQLQNAMTALQTVSALRARGWKIDPAAVVRGLAAARMPGRLERLRESPLVLLDGAHNEGGVAALCRTVDEFLKMRRLHVVMGMVRDKDFEVCVRELACRADSFYACEPGGTDRALCAQTLAALAERDCDCVSDCGGAAQAIALALERAEPKDCVLVCGSLFLVGEAEKILRTRQKPAE